MKYDVGGLERTRLDVALESEAVEDPDSKLPLSQYELQDFWHSPECSGSRDKTPPFCLKAGKQARLSNWNT